MRISSELPLVQYLKNNFVVMYLIHNTNGKIFTDDFRHKMSLHLQICTIKKNNDLVLKSKCKYVNVKIHWAPQIKHQNLAVILWQLYYGKISFIVMVGLSKSVSILINQPSSRDRVMVYLVQEVHLSTPNFGHQLKLLRSKS